MKSTSYKIRPAGFEDAEAIFDLIRKFKKELVPRAISDIVKNIDRFIVCDAGGRRIVGCVSWQILPEIGAPRDPSVEIKSLAVNKRSHGKGIGSSLVRAAIFRIEQLHPVQIIVLTFTPPFFETLGFKRIQKDKLIPKIYSGCVNCSKYDSPFTCPEVAMGLNMRDLGKPGRPIP